MEARLSSHFPTENLRFRLFLASRLWNLPYDFSASIQPMNEDTSKDLPVSGNSIRRRFLSFYASRGHKVLPSASLVPDDPTGLLTIAGMLQFKPIFLGKVPRQVPRAATAQRCIRNNDMENVG